MQLDLPLPRHVPEQISLYQGEHLLSHDVCDFAPARAVALLRSRQDVLAIDLGGDKIRCATYGIRSGTLVRHNERVLRSLGGRGYLEFMERLTEEAAAKNLSVGISSATKMRGSIIERTVNLPVFFEEISSKYGADYEKLFPGRSMVVNDTVAGICGASMLLALEGAEFEDVSFFICGSGLGASVISHGVAIHVEAAHVPLVEELNPFGQRAICGIEGRVFTCLDRVVPGRTGIEDIYRQQVGESLDGVALGRMYEEGDALVAALYEASAQALAHAIAGVMQRYSFSDSERSVVVLHGGNFEIARYRAAIQRHLAALPHSRCRIVFSRDLSDNVCLDGAAVMAVWREAAGKAR